jgi:predicted metal-dependent HD superfamily phosphohydrolase
MQKETLQNVWNQLMEPYAKSPSLIEQGFELITTHYSETHRHYHNLQHIYALLQLQLKHSDLIADNENFLLAIFFHDLIYDAKQADNEEKSAMAAIEYLSQTSYPAADIEGVANFIRATKTHTNPDNNPDLDYFLDFDLSVLSAPADSYAVYAKQIREEYNIYTDEIYNAGRKKVLQHFLELPAIYKTAAFREQRETIARQNITTELNTLQ